MYDQSTGFVIVRAGLLSAALCLTACGGGGGGGGGNSVAPVPAFSLAQSDVSVTSDTSSSSAPFASIDVTTVNATGDLYLGGTYSNAGLWLVSSAQQDATHYTVSMQFRDPPTLAPGTYNDTITLHLCSDQACAQPVSASQAISTHYVVTGTAIPRPQLTVGTTSIAEQTLSFVPAQQASIPITFQNLSSLRALDKSTTTNNAIASISYFGPGGATGSLGVVFKPSLPIGTYRDVVTIALCDNDTTNCQETIKGSGATVSVTLTVADTITGANGYSVKFAQVSADGLAWDAQRQVIYASTRSDSASLPQSIVAIDPLTGSVVASAALAGGPGKLAISGDGTYLYAGEDATGAVSRLVLPALTVDFTIPLPVDPSVSGPLRAKDIQVSPDSPHVVAIAVAKPPAYTPNCHSLLLFEDSQVRASLPGNGTDAAPCTGSVQWGANGSVLYADDVESYPSDIYRITVGASSMTSALMIPGDNFLYAGPIQYRSGMLYTAGGVIYDTVSGTVLGQVPTPVNVLLRGVFSPETHRVIAVDDFAQGLDGIRITAFDTTTFTEIAHIDFPHLYLQQNPDGTSRPESEAWNAIRWGADGYAVPLTDGRVLLIKGAFVGP